jgi:hypothetical protein
MSSDQEQKIQNALNDLHTKRFKSIEQAAVYNEVPRSTLSHRLHGRRSVGNIERKSQRLMNEEERVLAQWIKDL